MRVALAGGTGLVGSLLAPLLVDRGHAVHLVQRRCSDVPVRGAEVHLAGPERWSDMVEHIAPDAAISALGTTMRRAGSQQAFRSVDHDLVHDFATGARAGGARHFILISSVGADARSSNYYLRIKGEIEQAIEAMGFDRLDLIRPGLLRGTRSRDRRPGERIAIALSPIVNLVMRGRLDRFAAIEAVSVASAAASMIDEARRGRFVHHNRDLKRLRPGSSVVFN